MPRTVESGARIPSDVPSRPRTFTHIRAVDGLRALAIIGVVAYHTRPAMLAGGFLGVTLFFVVSGFFLTRSMLRLFSGGGFRYATFLKGRAKRIWPAVLTTIGFVAVLAWAVAPMLLMKARADTMPSALFYSNWWFIFRHQSYFETSGLPSPLTHLWYTSLIMQFYLLWPLLFALVCRVARSRKVRAAILVALIVASTVEMALLYRPGQDVSRIYYGLDTRAAELLVGALLAVLTDHDPQSKVGLQAPHWRRRLQVRGRELDVGADTAVSVLAAAITLVFVIAMVAVRGTDGWLYHGGLLLFALLSATLLWCGMQPGVYARVMGCRPLQYLGSRSFSIYLVHYPLLEVMNPATRTHRIAWYEWLGQFLLILVAAEILFQLVEAMHGTRWLPWIARRDGLERSHSLRRSAWVISGVGALIAFLLVLPLPWQQVADSRARTLRPELQMTREQAQAKLKETPKPKPTASPTPSPSASAPTKPAPPKPLVKALVVPDNLDPGRWQCDAAKETCNVKLLMVGDSVTAGVTDVMREHFPNAHVDGAVSRQFGDGLPIMQQAIAAGEDPQVIVYALGTNGAATADQVAQVIDAAQGRPLYFLTTRAPVDWVEGNNQLFLQEAKSHANVGVIDWAGLSGAHPDYLYDDGIHPNALGQEAFVQMMFEALCPQS